jgi:hypothetical protein
MNFLIDQVREHMAVVDINGLHVGTVDRVEGPRIKLTRSDSPDPTEAGDSHIALSLVRSVDDDTVRLTVSALALAEASKGLDDEGPEGDDTVRMTPAPVNGDSPDIDEEDERSVPLGR